MRIDLIELFPWLSQGLSTRIARLEAIVEYQHERMEDMTAAQQKLLDAIAELKQAVADNAAAFKALAGKVVAATDDGDEEAILAAAAEITAQAEALEAQAHPVVEQAVVSAVTVAREPADDTATIPSGVIDVPVVAPAPETPAEAPTVVETATVADAPVPPADEPAEAPASDAVATDETSTN